MVFTNVINPRSHVPRKDEFKDTLVRRGASIGANATVLCGVTLGRYSFVGAASVITRDVPDYGLVFGNPGRLKGWMCVCGLRLSLGVSADTEEEGRCSCGRGYRRTGSDVVALGESEIEIRP